MSCAWGGAVSADDDDDDAGCLGKDGGVVPAGGGGGGDCGCGRSVNCGDGGDGRWTAGAFSRTLLRWAWIFVNCGGCDGRGKDGCVGMGGGTGGIGGIGSAMGRFAEEDGGVMTVGGVCWIYFS